MKTCTKCKQEKKFKDFNRRDGTKDGYLSYCRECYNEKSKFYHERNKQKKEALKKDIRYVQD